jgi:hypothetical protein
MHAQTRTADGLVTRTQLLAAGMSRTQIRRRLRKRVLVFAYPGVYWVGHEERNAQAQYRAAVLACGDGAVLSGKAAAHLWGILKGSPPKPDVTTTRDLRIKGIRTRRSRRIDPRDVTTWRGIPITTVPRTIVDLAGDLTEDELALSCHEAGIKYKTTPAQVEAVLARRPNAKGAANLRRVTHGDVHVALSKLERGFLDLLRAEGLPLPVTNKIASARRVDCRWPEHNLTVELDSYTFHNSRHSWEQGYEREREAYEREDAFRRYTWRDVFEDPTRMLAELRKLLVYAIRPG